jgi:hypothetical protein
MANHMQKALTKIGTPVLVIILVNSMVAFSIMSPKFSQRFKYWHDT